jgi:hypothetical protein
MEAPNLGTQPHVPWSKVGINSVLVRWSSIQVNFGMDIAMMLDSMMGWMTKNYESHLIWPWHILIMALKSWPSPQVQ